MAWQVDEDFDDLKEVSAVPVQVSFTNVNHQKSNTNYQISTIKLKSFLNINHQMSNINYQMLTKKKLKIRKPQKSQRYPSLSKLLVNE